jgi:hypothetical protein
MKGGRVEGEKVRTSKVRLKASKQSLSTNSHELNNIRHFNEFATGSVHLKKPSVGPKGLIGPPCHGAPGRRRQKNKIFIAILFYFVYKFSYGVKNET